MRSPRAIRLTAVARHVGTATLAGVISGIFVGGLLGRVVMRIAGFAAGPGLVGSFTANGNRVGDITVAGTAAIVLFVGLSSGLIGGVLYAVIEPWLRRLRPWHGLAYGTALLGAFGFTVLDPSNLDFRRFGSAPLNVVMFALLFLLFGVTTAWLFDRVRSLIDGATRPARVAKALAFMALIPAAFATVLLLTSVTGLAEPLFPIVVAVGLLTATVVRWRGLPDPIGYAALGATMLLG
ncbi:MAG TPA: hypothetical protein VIN37_01625, partial [Candidatus Limnocylindria bacterium]